MHTLLVIALDIASCIAATLFIAAPVHADPITTIIVINIPAWIAYTGLAAGFGLLGRTFWKTCNGRRKRSKGKKPTK